jgi:hypothetical protein
VAASVIKLVTTEEPAHPQVAALNNKKIKRVSRSAVGDAQILPQLGQIQLWLHRCTWLFDFKCEHDKCRSSAWWWWWWWWWWAAAHKIKVDPHLDSLNQHATAHSILGPESLIHFMQHVPLASIQVAQLISKGLEEGVRKLYHQTLKLGQ